jgi:hypothetical protein
MMAIQEASSVDEQGMIESASPITLPQEQRKLEPCMRCEHSCKTVGCPCEGFQRCVGHHGHRRRPHQCGDMLGIASGSSSNQDEITESICAALSTASAKEIKGGSMTDELFSDSEIMSIIPRRMVDDTLACLRGLRNDKDSGSWKHMES